MYDDMMLKTTSTGLTLSRQLPPTVSGTSAVEACFLIHDIVIDQGRPVVRQTNYAHVNND
jgi:hypothetical protein